MIQIPERRTSLPDGVRTAPRVLLVSNSRRIGGGATCLLTYANELRRRGVASLVVHPERGIVSELFDSAGHAGVLAPSGQPSWRQPVSTWRGALGWRRLLREHRIDVVHANDPSTARAVALACGAERVPYLCHVHFPVDPTYAGWVFRRLPPPSSFAFCSDALRMESGPLFERAHPRVPQEVVYNAIDTETFAPVADRATRMRRPRVGIVGHLQPVKGHEDFVAMAAELTRRSIDAEYVVVGSEAEPGWEAHLRAITRARGLEDRVQFTGYCSDVQALLNGLDVLVCSSRFETFGRCLVEAMSCEVPVVATRVGGIPEAVAEGVSGLLVPPGEPVELAEAVSTLLADAGLRRSLGLAGRERVRTRFGPGAQVDQCLLLYAGMLRKGRR